MLSTQISDTITKFTEAFNRIDLDLVMTFFCEDAVYEPGDGKSHKGKDQIRAALEPQFSGAYGVLRFDERDRVIDVENQKAAFRWVCRHDIAHSKSKGLFMALRRLMVGLFVGSRFGWQGVDVFHFDADGKIKGKFTYGWFGNRPHIQRGLGFPTA